MMDVTWEKKRKKTYILFVQYFVFYPEFALKW